MRRIVFQARTSEDEVDIHTTRRFLDKSAKQKLMLVWNLGWRLIEYRQHQPKKINKMQKNGWKNIYGNS